MRRGLLKVEQLHALARAVYYGQRGRISAGEVYDQMNACSCLTLILACIVYWQAREISRLAAAPDFPFDPDLLPTRRSDGEGRHRSGSERRERRPVPPGLAVACLEEGSGRNTGSPARWRAAHANRRRLRAAGA